MACNSQTRSQLRVEGVPQASAAPLQALLEGAPLDASRFQSLPWGPQGPPGPQLLEWSIRSKAVPLLALPFLELRCTLPGTALTSVPGSSRSPWG